MGWLWTWAFDLDFGMRLTRTRLVWTTDVDHGTSGLGNRHDYSEERLQATPTTQGVNDRTQKNIQGVKGLRIMEGGTPTSRWADPSEY